MCSAAPTFSADSVTALRRITRTTPGPESPEFVRPIGLTGMRSGGGAVLVSVSAVPSGSGSLGGGSAGRRFLLSWGTRNGRSNRPEAFYGYPIDGGTRTYAHTHMHAICQRCQGT